MSVSDDVGSIRSLSQISEEETVKLSVDLVAAARHNLGFLRLVDDSDWLHQKPSILESIRRYDQLWMPLISDLAVGSTPPMVLPPLDVEWIWFCHTLNPVSYREYCKSRFSKLIGKAAIFDEENEEYALNRCKEIWEYRYPSEPFESEFELNLEKPCVINEDLLDQVSKQRYLYTIFNEPYRSEVVYLIAARQSYKGFLYSLNRISERCSLLVPPSDVLLMWLTHQSYPTVYAQDTKELEGHIEKVHGAWDDVNVKEGAIEEAKNMWEEIFDRPYEKAGGSAIGRAVHVKPPFYWDASDTDVNTKYRSLVPRFLLEFCISVKLSRETRAMKRQMSNEFLRLRMARCHKELKLDKPLLDFRSESWRKAWHLYCEFGTKGAILELRQRGGRCFKGSNLQCSIAFLWNDLLRARSLTWSKEIDQVVKADASITPPVQAPYLLKCVPDRVTDDSGAMISDVILRMNEYRPQAGRWLSRTVLDHAGRECFVIRMRMGGGFWRRGGETPSAVKWEDRIIEIREGSWSYVASSIGKAPEKVVGTATPQEPPEEWQASWNISTGNELLIRWGSPTSSSGFNFVIRNKEPTDRMVRLLKGRKMQYQVKKSSSASDSSICKKPNDTDDEEVEEEEEEEDGFITLVRFSEELPTGKATALLNWKLPAVEVLPEEDAVFVLLICLSVLRSISEMKKEDVGSLLIRRRIKEPKPGERDWGSIMLHPSSYSPSISSPYLQPWYWNAETVVASKTMDDMTRPSAMNLNHSPAEGGDKLYKGGVFALKKL
ncbi:uncharacterized protein [Coffea arabica]|uniref:Uncharacterized protein isoform X1 n=1 Tax=Coffea arabica TaxID=13443 RepID=A0A6P6WH37_COFAR|nr:uncharacterized protein LOC113732906 isoform X1 [Coffea arabica]